MKTLIVDDSKFIRAFLKESLERMGAECTEAEDGWQALMLLRGGAEFELMLIDMNMPVMNGLECVTSLRREGIGRQMKVMMVTTEADHVLIEQVLDFGADEFLMKPFTSESLMEKLMLMGLPVAV